MDYNLADAARGLDWLATHYGLYSLPADVVDVNHAFVDAENDLLRRDVELQGWEEVPVDGWMMGADDDEQGCPD
jgi:hypothetical protein